MNHYYGLEQLARFAPQIFGRALSLDGMLGSLKAASGRSDHIDTHTNEMRAALEALRTLQRLAVQEPIQAQVLLYGEVICGPEARRRPDTWLQLALFLSPPKKKKTLSLEETSRFVALGLWYYGQARERWAQIYHEALKEPLN